MKILQVNNFHYLRGGSERAYFDNAKILKQNGHEVAFFSTLNPRNKKTIWEKYFVKDYDLKSKYGIFQKIKITSRILYNREARKKIKKLIKNFKPDIAHLHNIYHHLSPSIILELKKQKIPVVMTLHDYKLISPNYSLFSRGKIWEKNKNGKIYKCLFDKCVNNSYSSTLVCVIEFYLHKLLKTYDKIDAFISPSEFLIDKFKEFGFKKKIVKIPNPLIQKEYCKKEESDYILYFGRLSEEKGVDDLISAYQYINTKTKLYIIGDGPQRQKLENNAKKLIASDRVKFLGYKTGDELWKLIASAKAVVFTSRWYENAPYAILEAMDLTKTVICAKIGGITEIIKNNKNGFLYEAGDRKQLSDTILKVLNLSEKEREKIGKAAKETVAKNNNSNLYYNSLIKIYTKIYEK